LTRFRDIRIAALVFGILGALSALSMAVFFHANATLFAAVDRGNYRVGVNLVAILISLMCIIGAGTAWNFPAPAAGILLSCILLVLMSIRLNSFSILTLLLLAGGSGLAIAAAVSGATRGQRASVVGRILGWLFLATGSFVLVQDLWASLAVNRWAPIALGQLWYNADRSSLNLVQAVIQRYLSVVLWNNVLQPILLSWAFAVLIVIGLALLILFRRRRLPTP
jgi:hypothetical protein